MARGKRRKAARGRNGGSDPRLKTISDVFPTYHKGCRKRTTALQAITCARKAWCLTSSEEVEQRDLVNAGRNSLALENTFSRAEKRPNHSALFIHLLRKELGLDMDLADTIRALAEKERRKTPNRMRSDSLTRMLERLDASTREDVSQSSSGDVSPQSAPSEVSSSSSSFAGDVLRERHSINPGLRNLAYLSHDENYEENDPSPEEYGNAISAEEAYRTLDKDESLLKFRIAKEVGTTVTRYGLHLTHVAVLLNRPEDLRALVEAGENSAATDVNDNTPLHLAARMNSPKMVKQLVRDFQCPVDAANQSSQTALHAACRYDCRESVVALCELNANVNETDFCGNTPLHFAAQRGCVDTAQVLIRNKANPEAWNGRSLSPIHIAASRNEAKFVTFLLECVPELVKCPTKKGRLSPSHIAAREGSFNALQAIVMKDSSADVVNAKDNEGCVPLVYAVQGSHAGCVELLLGHRADLNARDRKKRSILCHAGEAYKYRLQAKHDDDLTLEEQSPTINMLRQCCPENSVEVAIAMFLWSEGACDTELDRHVHIPDDLKNYLRVVEAMKSVYGTNRRKNAGCEEKLTTGQHTPLSGDQKEQDGNDLTSNPGTFKAHKTAYRLRIAEHKDAGDDLPHSAESTPDVTDVHDYLLAVTEQSRLGTEPYQIAGKPGPMSSDIEVADSSVMAKVVDDPEKLFSLVESEQRVKDLLCMNGNGTDVPSSKYAKAGALGLQGDGGEAGADTYIVASCHHPTAPVQFEFLKYFRAPGDVVPPKRSGVHGDPLATMALPVYTSQSDSREGKPDPMNFATDLFQPLVDSSITNTNDLDVDSDSPPSPSYRETPLDFGDTEQSTTTTVVDNKPSQPYAATYSPQQQQLRVVSMQQQLDRLECMVVELLAQQHHHQHQQQAGNQPESAMGELRCEEITTASAPVKDKLQADTLQKTRPPPSCFSMESGERPELDDQQQSPSRSHKLPRSLVAASIVK